MFLELVDGEIIVSEQGLSLKEVQALKKSDRHPGKPSYKKWLRFIYFAYHKKSIYRNYLPREREKKVKEALFPDEKLAYFLSNTKVQTVAKVLIELSYTFKEKLYRTLLGDIEDMMERVSKVEMTRTARITAPKKLKFYSESLKTNVEEVVNIDTRLVVDNSEEKFKALELLEKLLKKEEILKDKLKQEEIELRTEQGQKRLFDE